MAASAWSRSEILAAVKCCPSLPASGLELGLNTMLHATRTVNPAAPALKVRLSVTLSA